MTSSELNKTRFSFFSTFVRLLLVLTRMTIAFPPGTDSALDFDDSPPYRRIIPMGPLITEIIFLLGAVDNLVGNTFYCQRPQAALNKEKVGSVQYVIREKDS